MSEAVSPLQGASYEGFVTLREAGLRGMITLRGDLGDTVLKNAVTNLTGTDFPAQRGISMVETQGIAWMSPDELLVFVPYAAAADTANKLSGALVGKHHLVANVSDARATFTIKGKGAREVIAKLAPVDMGNLEPGEIRRSRLAQVAAAFWLSDVDEITLVTFRSTARYVFDLLCNAAKPGSEVGYL